MMQKLVAIGSGVAAAAASFAALFLVSPSILANNSERECRAPTHTTCTRPTHATRHGRSQRDRLDRTGPWHEASRGDADAMDRLAWTYEELARRDHENEIRRMWAQDEADLSSRPEILTAAALPLQPGAILPAAHAQ